MNNYRLSTEHKKDCSNCVFRKGIHCKKYDTDIELDYVCDEWKKRKQHNKIHKLSYFKHRLKQCGIFLTTVEENYPDNRKWSVLIGPNKILCTCKLESINGEQKPIFYFTDHNEKIMIDIIIKTESMNVIINTIKKYM